MRIRCNHRLSQRHFQRNAADITLDGDSRYDSSLIRDKGSNKSDSASFCRPYCRMLCRIVFADGKI
jgi:hypothetical protein